MKEEILNTVYASTVNGRLTVDELLKREIDYPYCSMLQFQLLMEYRQVDLESLAMRSEKAAIYFPNLLKLKWQLHVHDPYQNFKSNEEVFSDTDQKIVEKKSENIFENNENEKQLEEELELKAPEPETDEILFKEDTIEETQVPDEPIEQVVTLEEGILNHSSNENELTKDDQSEYIIETNNTEEKQQEIIAESQAEMISNEPQIKELLIHKIEEKEIAFDPLYTRDYFASQGIKLLEAAANDKLGNQMKSFTQWLKSMKKINMEKLNEPDEVVDKRIQSLAENSNTTEEIITESMADVLLLQGKHEKAVEMYEKLSLINPSKSAYFAAIIQVLKKQ